jgi:4-diphosphocytidyl-2-C-methyl-D-erythritol kinase
LRGRLTGMGLPENSPATMRLSCPAKINLHLRVGSRRQSDGFHPLLTWMTTVSLFDTLTLDVRPPGAPADATSADEAILRLSSDAPGLPCDATNLVVRAADALAAAAGSCEDGGSEMADGTAAWAGRGEGTGVDAAGIGPVGRQRARVDGEVTRVRPVDAALAKRIPPGAGLGGGSANAAATLRGLDALWRTGWPTARLAALAATLGSDVPFFLHGPSSVCTGRGERVSPVPPPALARWAVLALPDVHMPTADVYRRFDEMGLGFDEAIDRPPEWNAWASSPSDELMPRLVNDLERPAFGIRPALGTLRGRIESALGRPVRMSGSGSSLFTLCDGQGEAGAWAERVGTQFAVRAIAVQLCPPVEDDLNGDFARA